LKKSLKIFLWTTLAIAIIIAIVVIGFPTSIDDTTINEATLADIKSVQQILTNNRDKIPQDSTTVFSPLAKIDAYGYMNANAIDSLFSFLTNSDREKIKSLFSKGEVIQIDIDRPKCIRFILKYSFNNYFLVNKWQTLVLVYNDNCVCDCQTLVTDEETVSVEKLGNGWYKVLSTIKRTPPHALLECIANSGLAIGWTE
jgi:hypothetical protein